MVFLRENALVNKGMRPTIRGKTGKKSLIKGTAGILIVGALRTSRPTTLLFSTAAKIGCPAVR